MRSDPLDLRVQRRLRDLALLNIHHQPVLRANESDVQPLLELVPLTSNHDPIPVTIRLRTRNHRRDKRRVNPSNPLKQIANLFVLEPKLDWVSDMLILAAAALAKI